MKSQIPQRNLEIMEMVTEIAASAATNQNVVFMIEFQEELIERLYRRMSSLLAEEVSLDDGRFND